MYCTNHNLTTCDQAWHEGGCGAYFQYVSADGYDISGQMYCETDAVERRFWESPDGPTFTEVKNRRGNWVDQDTRRARKQVKVTWHDVDTNKLSTTYVMTMLAAETLAMEVCSGVSGIRINNKIWQ